MLETALHLQAFYVFKFVNPAKPQNVETIFQRRSDYAILPLALQAPHAPDERAPKKYSPVFKYRKVKAGKATGPAHQPEGDTIFILLMTDKMIKLIYCAKRGSAFLF